MVWKSADSRGAQRGLGDAGMVAGPRAVCRRGQVRRRHATCGMCRVPRARRALAPDASPGECCKRVTCHGHALDRRGCPRTTASPRRVRACMLASWDLSAQQTCRVCGNSGIPGCHQYGASRVTSGGRGPCMTAAFTASRHFMATLGAPRPRRSWRHGNCSPTRVASSTRCCRRAVGCVDQCAARGSRTSSAPGAWLRAHQNVGSHDFTDRCAHGQRVEEKGNN